MKYSPQTTEEEFKEAVLGFQDWSSSTLFSEEESGALIISPHMNASWNTKQLRSGHVMTSTPDTAACSWIILTENLPEPRWLIIVNRSLGLKQWLHLAHIWRTEYGFISWLSFTHINNTLLSGACQHKQTLVWLSDLVIDDFNNEGAARTCRHLLSVLQILLRRQQDGWMW